MERIICSSVIRKCRSFSDDGGWEQLCMIPFYDYQLTYREAKAQGQTISRLYGCQLFHHDVAVSGTYYRLSNVGILLGVIS
jgi:hypothetical protein